MRKAFFKPWVGKDYNLGLIMSRKVLVVGASSYCTIAECPHYQDCALCQNTSAYDTLCPFNEGKPLSEMPQTEFDEDGARSFGRFLHLMKDYLQTDDIDYIYDHLAFTNYVQHIIGGRTKTLASDCRPEYLDAFIEVIDELQPDLVIVWGCVINAPLRNCQSADVHLIDGRDYLFQWRCFHGRDILFLNFYHPSSPKFYTDSEWATMVAYLDQAKAIMK